MDNHSLKGARKGDNMGKLAQKGKRILNEQYKNRQSRDELKKIHNGRHSEYQVISSKNSLKSHTNNFNQFANWVESHYGFKSLKKIDEKVVANYITEQQKEGFSEKTLKSRITAINHVMVHTVWKVDDKVSLREMREKGLISSERGATGIYKDLTAKEFRERKSAEYEKNQEIIDFSRAFGLRKSEITGKNDGSYKGITDANIWQRDGKMFVEVIGKGGKYRLAACRNDMNQQMLEKYGNVAKEYNQNYFSKSVSERESMLKAISNDNKRLFSKTNVSLHINRNEYVEQLLKERQAFWEQRGGGGVLTKEMIEERQVGFSRVRFNYDEGNRHYNLFSVHYKKGANGEVIKEIKEVRPFSLVKVGNWQGYAISAADVMRNVGHNRLDVLAKYLY